LVKPGWPYLATGAAGIVALEEHGYVRIEKTFEDRRPRTGVQATPDGLAALQREAAALRDLLRRLDSPATRSSVPRRVARDTGPAQAGV
jgi:DNA-binding PadR family transcriptional regulator